MSADHDALLRAVLDRPADDLPRLVLADWLDEHGQPERAEFIRVQCELARYAEHDPRPPELEDREHELLTANETEWCPGLGFGDIYEWEWRRGFVHSVTISSHAVEVSLPRAASAHPITHVCWRWHFDDDTGWTLPGPLSEHFLRRIESIEASINPPAIDEADLWFVPTLTALTRVDLCDAPGIGQLADLLRRCPLTPQLTALAFGGRSGPNFQWGDAAHETVDAAGLAAALHASPLESLAAFDCGLTGDGLRTLLAAPFAAHLRTLDIADNPIAPDAWRAFRAADPAMRLRRLDVSGTPLAGISLEPLLDSRSLESLTALEMNRCGSARKNLEVLAASGYWTRATELRAHSGTIPASTLEPLCRSVGPPALRLLDLGDNYLRREGVELLCDAPWAGSLTFLTLSANYLDDEAVRLLATSGRFTELRTLHLSFNNVMDRGHHLVITDRGARALAAAPSLARLRLLTLTDSGITDAGLETLLNAPHWRLSGLGVGSCDLGPASALALAKSPRTARLNWLDLSDNPRLAGSALRPLAESPYLSRLCELDIRRTYADDATREALRQRLGPRLSE